jgi:Protein of unknown function (DUF2905)
MRMARFLLALGLIVPVTGLIRPYLAELRLGRPAGDVARTRGNAPFYFPIATPLVLSAVPSLLSWPVGR